MVQVVWPSAGTRKKRRRVASSIAASREPPGPTTSSSTRGAARRLYAWTRFPGAASERSRRSTCIARSGRRRRCRHQRTSGTCGEDLARAIGDVLARHLHEPERRDLDDVGLRPVALELLAERVLDRRAVLRVRHVDEVDDDDAADVAQPQLAHDLLDGFEVVLRDRVLEALARVLRARADEPARVDVDDGERLGVVEDEVPPGGQVDAAIERRGDLLLDAGASKSGSFSL